MKRFLSIVLSLALCLTGLVTLAEAGKGGWVSSNSDILEVDAQGNYTAIGSGAALVTATINEQTVAITVTVEPFACPWCEAEVTTMEEMENHAVAPCGVEGHGVCDGLDHEIDLDPYCPDENVHKACQAGATHVCDGEYGCGKTYACEDSGSHTSCAMCGMPWYYKDAGNHTTPNCGRSHHRACVQDNFDWSDHERCGYCGDLRCDGDRHGRGVGECAYQAPAPIAPPSGSGSGSSGEPSGPASSDSPDDIAPETGAPETGAPETGAPDA